MGERRQALEGYRIVDLTQVWAGPQLCATLGDFGAEVIRVESASSTDQARLATAGKSEFRRSLEMQRHPRNREYFVTLNLGTAEGNTIFREIVSTADIFVCNLSPRVMAKMRIRYEDLRAVRPDIIVVTISAAGKDGPFKDLMAFGPTFNAFIGHDSLVGYPETGELMSAYWDPDAAMGVMGCYAAMLAIWHREATGEGQHVDLSFSELLAGFLGEAALEYQMTGKVPGPQGNRHPLFAPHGIYPCAGDDRWVSIAIATDDEWRTLTAAMGQPSLALDPRFATAAQRLEHRDELDSMVAQWTRPQANSAVMHLLQSVGVATTPAASIAETYDDPHHTFRRQRADILTNEVANEDLLFGFPWRMSATPGTIRRLGKPVGHDNARFYPEMLGISPSRFADLTQRKVLA